VIPDTTTVSLVDTKNNPEKFKRMMKFLQEKDDTELPHTYDNTGYMQTNPNRFAGYPSYPEEYDDLEAANLTKKKGRARRGKHGLEEIDDSDCKNLI
jgi:hypothetical protein